MAAVSRVKGSSEVVLAPGTPFAGVPVICGAAEEIPEGEAQPGAGILDSWSASEPPKYPELLLQSLKWVKAPVSGVKG